jgi:hypothetical protein
MNRKIVFMIIGAQRAATSSLYIALQQHPDIYLPSVKEPEYFTRDEFYRKGEKYLNMFYHDLKKEKLVGGANAHLMYFPNTVERLKTHNFSMKHIAILRNPVDRAYSAFHFARSRNVESCVTFEEALQKESTRLHGKYKERSELTYLSHGYYAAQLKRFFDSFGINNVFIIWFEDIRIDFMGVLKKTLIWLGTGSDAIQPEQFERVNVASSPRFKTLQKILYPGNSRAASLFRKIIPGTIRYLYHVHVKNPLARVNSEAYSYEPMNEETRKRLIEYFRPVNAELEKLVDKDLSHWNR